MRVWIEWKIRDAHLLTLDGPDLEQFGCWLRIVELGEDRLELDGLIDDVDDIVLWSGRGSQVSSVAIIQRT